MNTYEALSRCGDAPSNGVSPRQSYFRAGGTLPVNAESYLSRTADEQVLSALLANEYVYVLDSRQKGKSSLLVQTTAKLRASGITTVRLDLQRIGSNLSASQWYASLLHSISEEVGYLNELFAFWAAHADLGPSYRCFAAIEHVLLGQLPGRVTVVIDEVDFVRSLGFSTDEFFASIRDFYNRRAEDPKFERICFCLVGVATPSQLIANEDVTPFNIGRRIELSDFSLPEIAPFAAEFRARSAQPDRVLKRLHFWTNGHPYLSQCLATFLAETKGPLSPRHVDEIVRREFLSVEGRQRQPNFADTERRLLEAQLPGETAEGSRNRVLEAYRQILEGHFRSAEHDASLVAVFLLSGVAAEHGDRMHVRNRLYRTMFDETWRRKNLPDAELRRQKNAANRAMIRIGAVSLVIVAVLAGGLLFVLGVLKDRTAAADEISRLSRESARVAYRTSMALASENLADGLYLKTRDLVQAQADSPDRAWEWNYLNAQIQEGEEVRPPSRDFDFRRWTVPMLLWFDGARRMELRNTTLSVDGQAVHRFNNFRSALQAAIWLSGAQNSSGWKSRLTTAIRLFEQNDTDALLSYSSDQRVRIRARQGERVFEVFLAETGKAFRVSIPGRIETLRVSPSGRTALFITNKGPYLYLLEQRRLTPDGGALSPDDRYVLNAYAGILRLRETRSDWTRSLRHLVNSFVQTTSFEKSGNRLAVVCSDGTIRIIDLPRRKLLHVLTGRNVMPSGVAFTSDGREVYVAYRDGSLRRWSLKEAQGASEMDPGRGDAFRVQLAPDGVTICSTTEQGYAIVGRVGEVSARGSFFIGPAGRAQSTEFTADGRSWIVIDPNGSILSIDLRTAKLAAQWKLSGFVACSLTKLPDGTLLAGSRSGHFRTLAGGIWTPVPDLKVPFEAELLARSPDGMSVVAASRRGECAEFDLRDCRIRREFRWQADGLSDLEYSGDGRWMARSTLGSNIELFDTSRPSAPPVVLKGHTARVWKVQFSPDNKKLLSISPDSTARVWDVATGKLLLTLGHPELVLAAMWMPDASRIVTAGADGAVRLFETKDGYEMAKLKGHRSHVLDLDLSADGNTIISSGADGALRYWQRYGKR